MQEDIFSVCMMVMKYWVLCNDGVFEKVCDEIGLMVEEVEMLWNLVFVDKFQQISGIEILGKVYVVVFFEVMVLYGDCDEMVYGKFDVVGLKMCKNLFEIMLIVYVDGDFVVVFYVGWV